MENIQCIQLHLLTPAGYRHSAWKNGGGTSTDILEVKNETGDEVFSFSRCEITSAGPYSDYSGNDRAQYCFRGTGMFLNTDEGLIDMSNHRVYRFPGEFKVSSRLDDGVVEVVNLIGLRSQVSIDLKTLISGLGGVSVSLTTGTHILFAPALAVEAEITFLLQGKRNGECGECAETGEIVRQCRQQIDKDHGVWFEIKGDAEGVVVVVATVKCTRGSLLSVASIKQKS